MADTPPLAPEYGYYQRLLARDPGEAADLIERHIKNEPWGTVYDALLLPALNYAERDRLENRLSPDEEICGDRGDARTADATRPNRIRRLKPTPPTGSARGSSAARPPRTAARAGLCGQRRRRRSSR